MKASFSKIFKNSIYLNKIIIKHSPILLVVIILSALADAGVACFKIVFTRYLVQNIQNDIEFGSILNLLLLWGGSFVILKGVISLSDNYFKPVYSKILIKKFDTKLYEKARAFDLECYDQPKFYDNYIWTTHNASNIILDASNSLGTFLKYLLELIGIISIVFIIDASMAILTLVSVVITLMINACREKLNVEYRRETMEGEKKRKYIERMFYLKDSAKDIRLTNIKEKFFETYDEAFDELSSVIHKFAYKIFFLLFISTYIFRYLLNTFLIYLYFAYKLLVSKTLMLSDFVAVNSAMIGLYLSLTRWSDQVNNLYKNVLYIESMKVFIEYEPKITSGKDALPIPDSDLEIKFVDVSFSYPGEDKPTLKNIDLTINPNKMLAIVGYNGAGKTTLIKLMLRLYDVTSGEVLLNGRNIKEYDLQQYRKCFGVVFQDFQIFACNIGENIAMDYLHKENEDIIQKAIDFADFREKYNGLTHGIDTPMTREFEESGAILSGGELQKIALARAYAQNSKIVILDEPSSSLDPISEYKINKHMESLEGHKTVILISHRLTSTRMADQIIMLSDGEIVEQGTHNQLIDNGGKYEHIYKVQAQQYIGKSVS